jgi:sulfatase modifying factor 1
MKIHTTLRAACILLLGVFTLHAGVPNLINYQGRLTDAQGNPVTGNRTMTVRVYDAPSGGNMTYEENIGTVAVANGTYGFQFGGAGDGIIGVLVGFSDYLALSVNGTEESGRTRLLAVPYALKAKESADALNLRAALAAAGLIFPNSDPEWTSMVTVQGGILPSSSELSGQTVSTFQIGRYEVTAAEWQNVQVWAVANGYEDLAGVGSGAAASRPVKEVSWYDVVKWMNAKSQMDGLTPVYLVNGATYQTGHSAPILNSAANGYRLPSEKEWEWAARGGVLSQGYTYSGSNDVNAVAWTYENSGAESHAVGTKAANELGIHDMSGNVLEWCEDLDYGSFRRVRGGGWIFLANRADVANRDVSYEHPNRLPHVGFRLARSLGL